MRHIVAAQSSKPGKSDMRILVTTPTGNIGSRIVDHLLAAGHTLTVLARDPSKLSDAARSRAAVVQGALDDAAAVAKALTDIDTAFFLIPPQMTEANWRAWQEGIGTTFITAAKQSNVSHIVFLSSTGAQHEGLGPISGTGAVERALNAALPNVLVVRAGGFMENTFGALPTIATQGAMYGVLSGDTQQQIVATRDIADVATRWLVDASWTGHHTVGAHGPTTISPNETIVTVEDQGCMPPTAVDRVRRHHAGDITVLHMLTSRAYKPVSGEVSRPMAAFPVHEDSSKPG